MSINRRSLFAVAAASAAVLAIPFAARAEGTLDEVKKRGVLRVGVTQAPPWYSKDPKTGQWASGLGIEMGKAMAQKLGVKLLVAGAFGHPRFQRFIFGGTTQTLLDHDAGAALFLSH